MKIEFVTKKITSWNHNINNALDESVYFSLYTLTCKSTLVAPFIKRKKCRCAHILHECFLF